MRSTVESDVSSTTRAGSTADILGDVNKRFDLVATKNMSKGRPIVRSTKG